MRELEWRGGGGGGERGTNEKIAEKEIERKDKKRVSIVSIPVWVRTCRWTGSIPSIISVKSKNRGSMGSRDVSGIALSMKVISERRGAYLI